MAKQIRARISPEEYDLILNYRGMKEEAEKAGINPKSINHGWYKSKHWSLHFKPETNGYDEIKRHIIDEVKLIAPKLKSKKGHKNGHLLVIDPADIHIGKLCSEFETGDKYSSDIAVKRVHDGVAEIIEKTRSFGIDKVLIIIGNDALHVDTPRSTTTSGTFQDSHLMWYDAFNVAFDMYVNEVNQLASIAPVHVQYNPSNHDYTTGFFLAQTIKSYFSKSQGITFDVSPAHRKYFRYGENLIGSTHGDGAKEQDLPLLMAHEAKTHWAECRFKYFYTHHIHHKKSRDYMGVTVEALRSPSGTDSWHHRNGYQHSPKAVEGFLHDKQNGQIGRFTNYF